MKAILMADQDNLPSVSQSLQQLDQERQVGWNGFARFLTVTAIGAAIILLVLAAFTVWS
jgi:hypothetical protein